MRFVIASMLLVACTVPDKNATTDAGPTDGPIDQPDPTAPETTIIAAPREFSNAGGATFAFESNVPDATFQCSIDEETSVACSSPYTRTLGDGPHGIVVRAISASGNSDDTPAEHRWMIDTVVPDTTVTEKPPPFDNSVQVLFDFESSEDNVTYDCSIDGGGFVACAPDDLFGPLGDGPHSFAVRARDRAGNVDATPAVYAWTINTLMPDTQILSSPGDITGSTIATFTFISPDAGSGATFDCSLDGAAFTACGSPITYTNLDERMHTFQVRVRDSVGNLDPTPATRAWMVDLSAPQTTITSGPNGTVATASATFMFTSNEDEVTFECQDDGAAFTACTSPHTVMMLSQGAHTFAVRAIDAAGHVDATPATASWTVDTVAPSITITSGPAAGSTSGPYVTFTFTSDGATECSVDSAAFAACTSPVSFNAPAAPHQFAVRGTDAAGNAGIETRSWTVACAAPSAAGAAGLLHLDDGSQSQVNDAGGAAAVLGDDLVVEPTDPAPGAGRFGGGLAFAGAQHVSWPMALGATTAFTVELWSQPSATPGAHVLFVSGDGRIAVRVTTVDPTTVRYSISVIEGNSGQVNTVTSADVTAGAWHHVVASLEEPTVRLWVDGTRTQVGGVNLMGAASLDTARLGESFSGAIDEVWVSQTAAVTDDDARSRYCPL